MKTCKTCIYWKVRFKFFGDCLKGIYDQTSASVKCGAWKEKEDEC
jgi:hypothetical protein